jgi:hypothetical protein
MTSAALTGGMMRLGMRNALVGSCELTNIPPVGARKKAGILDSGLFDHEMVAGVRFELTTFGLCDLTQLSLRVGPYLHLKERNTRCRGLI